MLWASYEQWQLHKSQNNVEEALWRLFASLLPQGVKVILAADRAFGRTELGRTCQQLGFHYVIRITADVLIRTAGCEGNLLDYPVYKGICRLLRNVEYRQHNPVIQHVVVRWKPGLPKDRHECWHLMTDLDRAPLRLWELYTQRMTVEQLFRGKKNRRNGFALRNARLHAADRFDRLVLILALACILVVGVGLVARQRYRPGMWWSNNRQKECSLLTIGRKMLARMQVSSTTVVAAVIAAIVEAAPNWG